LTKQFQAKIMKNLLLSLLVLFCLSDTYAQVGIKANNTVPIPSAQLEVQSTTKAFYPPRMNTAQKNAISGVAAGAMVFDTDLGGLFTYNGSVWVAGSGLTLPYSATLNDGSSNLLFIENSSTSTTSASINGKTNSNVASAIIGLAWKQFPSGNTSGIQGFNSSLNANGYGVYGNHQGIGIGVYGESSGTAIKGVAYGGGTAGYFNSFGGKALQTDGAIRIGGSGVGTLGADKFLKSINANGDAQWSDLLPYNYTGNLAIASGSLIFVENTNTTSSHTIYGATNSGYDVGAVYGVAYNTNPSLYPSGLRGRCLSTNSNGFGVFGEHVGYGSGVYGISDNGYGVKGLSQFNYGVYGEGGKIGVWGYSPTIQGVQGSSSSGIGVIGISSSGNGGYFYSTSGYALVTGTGNVGIGTLTPVAKMDIKGSVKYSHFYYGANEDTYIRGGKAGSNVIINDEAGLGNVVIGLGTATEKLHVFGNIKASGIAYATAFTIASDVRFKKNIVALNNSLANLLKINGVRYDLRKDEFPEKNFSGKTQIGFIAQELEKIFPEMVFTDTQGYKSVDYARLTPVLVEAIKELRNENVSLKSRLDKIEALLTNSQLSANNVVNK
jgi:hypothetical protein